MGSIIDRLEQPDRDPWLHKAELAEFKSQRALGRITFFRVGKCRTCQQEVPKSISFCSEDCYKISTGSLEDPAPKKDS